MTTHLYPLHFTPLPLGSIRPLGWLRNQLQLQAQGISGKLDEFWPDIAASRWFGGDREGWERAPYWLDGVIPLAYVLDDAGLKEKVTHYLDFIITHQHEDGWLGPKAMVQAGGRAEEANYDLWGQMLATKVLVQYHEASGDGRALSALEKALRCMDVHIDRAPLFNWGQFRWFETLIAIFYLYERTGEQWLIDLAIKLQAQGFDWESFFARWPLTAPTPKGRWNYMGHVVNNAMAPKGPALWQRITGDARQSGAVQQILAQLDRHHGQVNGMFSGDECLAGLSPLQGTELCAVVEMMYSLEVLLSIYGDATFGDQLEKIAFNALPATFSPDMWAHQYDQQVNQVECSVLPGRTWNTNGPASNTFGVEPNYGCCTANLSQGWPKFAANLWMQLPQGAGLACVAYAPSQARCLVNGVPLTVSLETDYPFGEELHFTLAPERPLYFPLLLRIPAWANGAQVIFGDGSLVKAEAGTYLRLERTWQVGETFVLTLPMRPALISRPGIAAQAGSGALTLTKGPLVYSLKIGEDWRRIHVDEPDRQLPHADWEVYPTTPWNYALQLSAATLDQDVVFHNFPVGDRPFSPEGAPLSASVRGRRLPDWHSENGSAGAIPASPATSTQPLEELTLIPYGCTNLRITEFPVL